VAGVDEEGAESIGVASIAPVATVADPVATPAVAASASPANGIFTLLLDRLARLESKVDELAVARARDQEVAAFRESVIDRLHAENQSLRRGEVDAALEPFRDGVVGVYDMARRAAAQYRSTDQPSAERGAALLEAVAEEAADILVRAGVTRVEPMVGEVFDPSRHRGVATTVAAQPWQDNTIADVSAIGFAALNKVIRRAEVVVARHEAGAQDVARRDPV
jgi:molecular chaperone GrpE